MSPTTDDAPQLTSRPRSAKPEAALSNSSTVRLDERTADGLRSATRQTMSRSQRRKSPPQQDAAGLASSALDEEHQLVLSGSTASRHGWVRVSDGTGRVFYHSISSGNITLERPPRFGDDNPTWADGTDIVGIAFSRFSRKMKNRQGLPRIAFVSKKMKILENDEGPETDSAVCSLRTPADCRQMFGAHDDRAVNLPLLCLSGRQGLPAMHLCGQRHVAVLL